MFKFCNLYSGSSGNSSLILTDKSKILVDCGVSAKKITTALENMGIDMQEIDGILLTHEHSDHVKGLSIISKNYHTPIYANEGTLQNISQDISSSEQCIFKTNDSFSIKDLKIESFNIPHDAADPVGFNIFYKNKKMSIATDIGHIENELLNKLEGSNFLMLESNYETEMLKSSKYPYVLKRRILGPVGHLSNEDASDAIGDLVKNGTTNIMLGHLSKENNFPELAYQTAVDALIQKNVDLDKIKLEVADRDKPNGIINI